MLLLLLLLGGLSASASVSVAADAIRGARCVLACAAGRDSDATTCADECLSRRTESKAGFCPDASALTVFEAACITACSGDADCPATDKCCAHACGVTCQPAHGLATVTGLPEIPSNVTASERGYNRAVVTVTWSSSVSGAEDLLFVLEERHHVGRRLSPRRLGPWATLHRGGAEAQCVLPRGTLRPGRWYEFRVAAVSANGSRGFSDPSQPFKLSAPPRPPKMPERLEVGGLLEHSNGTLSGVLSWQAPDSDLPVQRYKIFWSRRLEASSSAGSVLVNHHTVPWSWILGNFARQRLGDWALVPLTAVSERVFNLKFVVEVENFAQLCNYKLKGCSKEDVLEKSWNEGSKVVQVQLSDVTRFKLQELQPRSLYFLQVQALSQYGNERLKSEKAAIFLDTARHQAG